MRLDRLTLVMDHTYWRHPLDFLPVPAPAPYIAHQSTQLDKAERKQEGTKELEEEGSGSGSYYDKENKQNKGRTKNKQPTSLRRKNRHCMILRFAQTDGTTKMATRHYGGAGFAIVEGSLYRRTMTHSKTFPRPLKVNPTFPKK